MIEAGGAPALSEDVCDLGELATASLDKSLTLLASLLNFASPASATGARLVGGCSALEEPAQVLG